MFGISAAAAVACYVLLEFEGGRIVGFPVEAMPKTVELAEAAITAAPDFGGELPKEYILGIGKLADATAIVLDAEAVFKKQEAER